MKINTDISRNRRKCTFCHVLQSKTQISLRTRVFIVHKKKLCILGYPKCAQWRFWSDCANAQSDLKIRRAPMSDVVVHMTICLELFCDRGTILEMFLKWIKRWCTHPYLEAYYNGLSSLPVKQHLVLVQKSQTRRFFQNEEFDKTFKPSLNRQCNKIAFGNKDHTMD